MALVSASQNFCDDDRCSVIAPPSAVCRQKFWACEWRDSRDGVSPVSNIWVMASMVLVDALAACRVQHVKKVVYSAALEASTGLHERAPAAPTPGARHLKMRESSSIWFAHRIDREG